MAAHRMSPQCASCLSEDAVQRATTALAAVRGAAELLALPDLCAEDRARWGDLIIRRVQTLDALVRGRELPLDQSYPPSGHAAVAGR